MAVRSDVTPNRRGTRSRETVLEAAGRLMAEQGFEAATMARLVEESGVPASSIYHYFGSKEGVLLAVMERGTERFFESLPEITARAGSPAAHLGMVVATVAETLEEQPDFLRLIIVMATLPATAGDGQVDIVVERVREMALQRLREQMGIAFRIDPGSADADHLARFALVAFDGAFVARQAYSGVTLAGLLEHLPVALVAVHRELRKR